MKTSVAFALIGSAAAFAPVQQGRVNTAIAGDARSPDGLGVDPGPLDLFDPLGLMEDTDSFPRRRAVEIKHGRIAMVSYKAIRTRFGSSRYRLVRWTNSHLQLPHSTKLLARILLLQT